MGGSVGNLNVDYEPECPLGLVKGLLYSSRYRV